MKSISISEPLVTASLCAVFYGLGSERYFGDRPLWITWVLLFVGFMIGEILRWMILAKLRPETPLPVSDDVLQLQQRLRERTEQSMLTCRRDAERIHKLQEENAKLQGQIKSLNNQHP